MDHKMTMLGTELLHMIFQLICVTRLCFLGYDTHDQSTSVNWLFLCPYRHTTICVPVLGLKVFFNYLAKLIAVFAVEVCIAICDSYAAATGSCTVVINIGINLFLTHPNYQQPHFHVLLIQH